MYTLREIKERIDELLELGVPEDTPALVAYNQQYPIQVTIMGLVSQQELNDDDDEETAPEDHRVWIVCGGSPEKDGPYAPRAVWN